MASLLNMRKNGAIPDDSVGKKLYAAVAFQTKSLHSTRFSNCFAIVAFRNLWNPSILQLYCGEYMGVTLCSVLNLLKTSVQSLFLNSVLLSVRIFLEGPKEQQTLFMYAFMTSSVHLVFSGVQNVNSVNIKMAVRGYLIPLLDAGWNSPIKSIAMNSMGWGGDEKCLFLSCCVLMLCFAHTWQVVQCWCTNFSCLSKNIWF